MKKLPDIFFWDPKLAVYCLNVNCNHNLSNFDTLLYDIIKSFLSPWADMRIIQDEKWDWA